MYNMKFKFTPSNNLHLIFVSLFYICPIIPLDIGCFIVCLSQFDFLYFITCVVLTFTPIAVWAFARIIYPYRYIIDDKYIIKRKGKKILFKIKIKNLKSIIFKKVTILDYFKFIFSLISYYNISTAHISCVSFVFNDYEVLTDYNDGEIKRSPLNCGLYPDCIEYIEIISYKKAQTISKILNTPLYLLR